MQDQDLQDPWQNEYQDPYQDAPVPPKDLVAHNDPNDGNANPGLSGGSTAPAPTPAPTGGDNWDAARVAGYFQSRGVTPNASSPDYWAQKWNEWGKNDPAYFMTRLAAADEFTGGGGGGGGSVPPPQGVAPPSQPQVPGATYNFSYNGGSNVPPGVSDELYSLLLNRAKQSTNIDANDPMIRQQVDPYTAQVERDRRNYLANVAEKRGPLANIQGETRVSAEKAGQAKGLFESTMVGKELSSRRDEIQNALTELGSRLSSDQTLALQKEMAYLTNALGKYGIDTSAGLQQQQINSNNDQFANTYNLNSTNQASYWDAVRQGLFKP